MLVEQGVAEKNADSDSGSDSARGRRERQRQRQRPLTTCTSAAAVQASSAGMPNPPSALLLHHRDTRTSMQPLSATAAPSLATPRQPTACPRPLTITSTTQLSSTATAKTRDGSRSPIGAWRVEKRNTTSDCGAQARRR